MSSDYINPFATDPDLFDDYGNVDEWTNEYEDILAAEILSDEPQQICEFCGSDRIIRNLSSSSAASYICSDCGYGDPEDS